MNDWVFEVDQTSGTQLAARLVQIGRDSQAKPPHPPAGTAFADAIAKFVLA